MVCCLAAQPGWAVRPDLPGRSQRWTAQHSEPRRDLQGGPHQTWPGRSRGAMTLREISWYKHTYIYIYVWISYTIICVIMHIMYIYIWDAIALSSLLLLIYIYISIACLLRMNFDSVSLNWTTNGNQWAECGDHKRMMVVGQGCTPKSLVFSPAIQHQPRFVDFLSSLRCSTGSSRVYDMYITVYICVCMYVYRDYFYMP